jgi:hypothetical protein
LGDGLDCLNGPWKTEVQISPMLVCILHHQAKVDQEDLPERRRRSSYFGKRL